MCKHRRPVLKKATRPDARAIVMDRLPACADAMQLGDARPALAHLPPFVESERR